MNLRETVEAVADEMTQRAVTGQPMPAIEVVAFAERLRAMLVSADMQPRLVDQYVDHQAMIDAEREKIRRERAADTSLEQDDSILAHDHRLG